MRPAAVRTDAWAAEPAPSSATSPREPDANPAGHNSTRSSTLRLRRPAPVVRPRLRLRALHLDPAAFADARPHPGPPCPTSHSRRKISLTRPRSFRDADRCRGRPLAMQQVASEEAAQREAAAHRPESRGAADEPNGRASARPLLSHRTHWCRRVTRYHGFQLCGEAGAARRSPAVPFPGFSYGSPAR